MDGVSLSKESCRFVEQEKSLNQRRKLQCAPAHCSFLRWAFQPLLAACCSLSVSRREENMVTL